jgi:hypothetical protein
MTNQKRDDDEGAPAAGSPGIGGEIAMDALAGAAAGAAVGAMAGPPGIAIGAIVGGAIGAAAGEALHMDHVEAARKDEQLDRDIGVSGGDIGEAPPGQPPARGVFHASSLGVGTEHAGTPSEGPMQDLDD